MGPLVKDLQAARGRSLVIAGEGQPPAVHALAHAMNAALGNVGATVVYTQTAEVNPMNQRAALQELVGEMNAGTVSLLVILGSNPVYTAPADLKFADAMDKVALRAHLGLYHDETAALCHWHIPEAHFLETWSDVRADDGTVTIVQPLIAPLYGGRSAHEVLSAFAEGGARAALRLVRSFWSASCRRRTSRQQPAGRAFPPPASTAPALSSRPGAMAARRHRPEHGVRAEDSDAAGTRRRRHRERVERQGSRSSSGPTRACMTAASRTMRGYRSCRSRSRS